MAGIEIAGLVLAALPFVADGIDKYVAAASRTGKLFHPTQELQSFRKLLATESQIFRSTSELLLEFVVDEAEVENLLREPGGQAWSATHLEVRMEQSLEKSYHTTLVVLKDIQSAIVELRSCLHLDPITGVNKAKDFSAFHKLWFNIGRQKQQSLLAQIQKGNSSFRTLINQSRELGPLRARKRRRRRDFAAARREATAMFRLLDRSLQCQCRPQHTLYLRLGTVWPDGDCDRSHFVLATDSARLTAFETKGTTGAVASSSQAAVQQLCHAFASHTAGASPKVVGFLDDGSSTVRDVVLNMVCLGNVDRFNGCTIPFSGRERRSLALIVAINVLRLYKTPWVDEQWVREYIAFARKLGEPNSPSPLLERELASVSSPHQAARPATQTGPLRLLSIRSESLFALGVFLIELCFRKPLASLQVPDDVIPGGQLACLTEFSTAIRLIPKVYDEVGQRYGDAVRRCIRCDFDHKEYDLENGDFCQAVFEGVVAPLEEHVKLIDGPDALPECANRFRLK